MPENEKRVILLTQKLSNTRDSVRQIKKELERQGCDVREIKIYDAEIKTIDGEERFFYLNEDITDELSNYDAVLKRSWDGGCNSQNGIVQQKFLEGLGLYADNSYESQRDTHDKIVMTEILMKNFSHMIPPTKIINNPKELKEFIDNNSYKDPISKTTYVAADIIGDIFSSIDNMVPPKQKKELPAKQACWLIKPQNGTAGNGIKFMNNAELLSKAAEEKLKVPFILQKRIKPNLFFKNGDNEKDSSHLRIILSRRADGTYEYLGGLKIGRRNSLISNISSDQGILETEILDKNEIPAELLQDLSDVATKFGIDQVGFDVINSENDQFYLLELNDGPGVTGELLDEQGVNEKYISSFIGRLNQVMQTIKDKATSWLPSGSFLDTQLETVERAKKWIDITPASGCSDRSR